MGGRDFRRREKKKTKKGTRKTVSTTIPQPTATVEVVRRKKGAKEAIKEREDRYPPKYRLSYRGRAAKE